MGSVRFSLCSWIFLDIAPNRGHVRLCRLLLVTDSTHLWTEWDPCRHGPLTMWAYGPEARTGMEQTDRLKLITLSKHVKIPEDKTSSQSQVVQLQKQSSVSLFSENTYNLRARIRQLQTMRSHNSILPSKLRLICKAPVLSFQQHPFFLKKVFP